MNLFTGIFQVTQQAQNVTEFKDFPLAWTYHQAFHKPYKYKMKPHLPTANSSMWGRRGWELGAVGRSVWGCMGVTDTDGGYSGPHGVSQFCSLELKYIEALQALPLRDMFVFFFLAVRYRRLGISSNSVSPASAFPIFLITFYRKVTVENSLFVSIFFQTNTAVISHVINSFEGPCLTI